ncbi:MAG: hypothetical protein R2695_11000 [Acidimicrobiales bacterium]
MLTPAAYFANEQALEVAPLPADGEVLLEGVGGAVVSTLCSPPTASSAPSWGGDQFTLWEDGDRSCMRWDLRADSTGSGRAPIRPRAWGEAHGAAISSVDDATIRVDRCS